MSNGHLNRQQTYLACVIQYRSEISELRIRSLYAHTRMTIRVYAYTNTRIGISLLFTSYRFFCELLLDKTITSFVRKSQKARAVRLQPNLHFVKTCSMKLSYFQSSSH